LKIFIIFLISFLNIILLYLEQYYPFFIAFILWATLLHHKIQFENKRKSLIDADSDFKTHMKTMKNKRTKKIINKVVHKKNKLNTEKNKKILYDDKIIKSLTLFGFSNINDITEHELRRRFKVLLSKNHPDKHINISELERKKIEKKFINIQENYEFLKKTLFNC
jgi:hypothetical protein